MEYAIERALKAHKEGNLVQAERLYRAVLQKHPTHADANHNLGLIISCSQGYNFALPYFKTALTRNPKIEQFWLSYIGTLINNNQLKDAKREVKRAKKNGLKIQKLEELISLSRSAQKNEEIFQNKVDIITRYYESGRFSEAEKLAISMTKKYSTNAFAWKFLGILYGQQGKKIDGLTATKMAIQLAPSDAEAHNIMGLILQELGSLNEAVDKLSRAISLKPDYAEAHYNLGVTLQEMGRLEASETSLRKAIECKNRFAAAHLNLGTTLTKLEQWKEALSSYKQALAIRPDYVEAYSNLGPVLRELGRVHEAEASLKKALELNPDYEFARANLGSLLLELGRFEEFEQCCKHLSKQNSVPSSTKTQASITCLLSHGRSGTMFFHSLFDGHPSLATLPGLYFKGWFHPESWQRFVPYLGYEDWKHYLVNIFLDEYSLLFDADSQKNVFGEPCGPTDWLAEDIGFTKMGSQGNKVFKIDKDSFSQTLVLLLKPYKTITCNSFFELVHYAFEISIRRKLNLKKEPLQHIFYHIHNPTILEKENFLNYYPTARFLLLTRNPIQSLESWILFDSVSLKDVKNIGGYWHKTVSKIIRMFLITNIKESENNFYRGVKLEDVKHDPTRFLPQIAGWMGISDHSSLYDSSFCGLKYWGPKGVDSKEQISGFDVKAINKSIGRIFGERDIVIFETLFWPFLNLYQYTNLNYAEFRANLTNIYDWLDKPLEFEERLYNALPEKSLKIEDVGPYKRLHLFLKQLWVNLDKEGAYKNMVQPLTLD